MGPFSTEEVRQRVRSGEIHRDALICRVGAAEWRPLTELAELAPLAPCSFDDPTEHTVVERIAFEPSTQPDDQEDDAPTLRPPRDFE